MALPRRRPTALVVDDVAFIRRLIGAALEKDGFAIEEAASAHEAGRALRRGAFDVVLLDVDLGGTATGYDLLGEVRRDPRLEGLPVILVTGTSCDPHAVARGLLAGATDHIAKPFDAVVLRARVASAGPCGRAPRPPRGRRRPSGPSSTTPCASSAPLFRGCRSPPLASS
jgi:CheY-like chemotaxis protein